MELFSLPSLFLLSTLFVFYISKFLNKRSQRNCYMLHYECFKGKDERKLDTETCAKVVERNKHLGLEEYRFLLRTMASSGIGEETYGPINVLQGREASPTLLDAYSEMDEIMFETLDKLFHKTKGFVSPSDGAEGIDGKLESHVPGKLEKQVRFLVFSTKIRKEALFCYTKNRGLRFARIRFL